MAQIEDFVQIFLNQFLTFVLAIPWINALKIMMLELVAV